MERNYGIEEIPLSAATQSESLLFVSGQGGFDPLTGAIPADNLEQQTINTMKHIENILAESQLTLNDILKVTIYLKHRHHYQQFNRVYSELCPRPYPARTVVYCDLNFDLLVEIDVIARLRSTLSP
ncbi:RidA family protein [Paenibacillus sp. GCM10027626]|uniref:RidA family protein n=1 Tax=Paenibacillus sp. GCM10027626 TaxID=3273411 RepID=UPI00362D0A3B